MSNVIDHPERKRGTVRSMMREICKGLPSDQAEHYMAGALAMLEMGSSIANINRIARYTVDKARIERHIGGGTD